MRKSLLTASAFALTLLLGNGVASAQAFEIEENFDSDASFTQGGVVPDGWAVSAGNPMRRLSAANAGASAHSGSYVLGSTGSGKVNSVIYTAPVKLAAGSEAAIEFQAYMPGDPSMPSVRNYGFTVFVGTSTDVNAMTEIGKRAAAGNAAWEKHVYTFTPTEDGEYYYAIRIDKGALSEGGGSLVMLDTFFFSGTKYEEQVEPPVPDGDPASTYEGMDELDPDPENLSLCMELPYFENFSDPTHYDGSGVLPTGWTSTGTNIWRTASRSDLAASDGDFYMTTVFSEVDRDERAYTPFFNLQQGVTYTISFDTHQESFLWDEDNDIRRISTIAVLVGTQHDADFLPVNMIEITKDNAAGEWDEHVLTFCPAVSGAYTFCFELKGLPYCGTANIDNVRITSPVDLARPEPAFASRALFNLMTGKMLTFANEPVRFVNTSNYADQIEWECSDEFTVLPNGDIDVFFSAPGEHGVRLTATNARGTRSTDKIYDVECVTENSSQMAVMGYDPNDCSYINRDDQLKFSTSEWDFVSGYNHYYNTYAEYYAMPRNSKFKVQQLSLWLAWLNYRPLYDGVDDQRIRPFTIAIYGTDNEGNLDESKLFGKYETTMNEVFGGSGTNEVNGRNAIFPEPIECDGPIYIVFKFSDEMDIDPTDPQFTRSYLAMNMVRHGHRHTSFYVKPHTLPEGSTLKPGQWVPVHELNKSYKGLGLAMQVWTSYTSSPGSVAINNMGEVVFAARYTDGAIEVSGTTEGEWLAVYTTAGQCVAMAQATDTASRIEVADLPAGVYIVKGNNGSAKFVK